MRSGSVSKVLFDVNVPRSASRFLTGHVVAFADRHGWRELSNGDLLSAAERDGFDVMLTADTNLRYQQNLVGRHIGIVPGGYVCASAKAAPTAIDPVGAGAAMGCARPRQPAFSSADDPR
jgi:hypothetical protein